MTFSVMQTEVAPAVIKGRAIGALFMAGFGALWMVIGLKFLQRLNSRSGLLVLIVTAVIAFGAIRDLRRANTLPQETTHATPAEVAAINHKFRVVLGIELLAIAAVVILFNLLRRPTFILPAVAVIVGLHFIPLAGIFGAQIFYSTGMAMVLTVLFAFALRELPRRQAAIGVGCGLVLWITGLLLI
jgi:hypothetical protein